MEIADQQLRRAADPSNMHLAAECRARHFQPQWLFAVEYSEIGAFRTGMIHLFDSSLGTLSPTNAALEPMIPTSPTFGWEGSTCTDLDLAYRPTPDSSGGLEVDPEIRLPSPGMDVEVAYFYNSRSTDNGAFGYGRTINVNLGLVASGSPLVVTLTRGNGARDVYVQNPNTGQYLPQTVGLINVLSQETSTGLWMEKTYDGRVSAYPLNVSGQICSIAYAEDAVGNRHTFTYDMNSGLLVRLTDGIGRHVTFSYSQSSSSNGSRLLTNICDWAARVTTFTYDDSTSLSKPLLVRVTGPTGCQTEYTYEAKDGLGNPLLNSITDPNGYTTNYGYDNHGRVVTRSVPAEEPDGTPVVAVTSYTYATDGLSMSVVDPLGAITTFGNDPAAGRKTAIVNALGNSSVAYRNNFGQEVARVDALGATFTTVYNPRAMAIGTVDALGSVTSLDRDAFNNPIRSVPAIDGPTNYIWGFAGSSFDETGAKRRMQVLVDPMGNRTSRTYNSRGQLATVQDPMGTVTSCTYDALGNRTQIITPSGSIVTLAYDLAGNIVRATNGLGGTTRLDYDAAGRVTRLTDPLGSVTSYAYDGVGKRTLVVDPLGQTTTYIYTSYNNLAAVVDPQGFRTSYSYDRQGRQTATIDPTGQRTTFSYDVVGNQVAMVDARGKVTSYVYGATGNVVNEILPDGGVTTFQYDQANNLTSITSPSGLTQQNRFDKEGRVIAQVMATGATITTVYNVAGQAIATVSPGGNISTRVYDPLARLVEASNERGVIAKYTYSADSDVPRAYEDAYGRRFTATYDAAGNKIAQVDPRGIIDTFIYNSAGQNIAVVDLSGHRTSYAYDGTGSLVGVQDSLGACTTYSYKVFGRKRLLSSVTTPSGSSAAITTFIYNPSGDQTGVQDALGRIVSTVFDTAGQETSTIYPDGTRTTVVYDKAGTSVSLINPLGQRTTQTIDVEGRLVGLQNAVGARTSYVFNAKGNLATVVDPGGHITSLSYDASGNMTSRQDALGRTTSFIYNQDGSPSVRVDANGRAVSYLYDLLGRPWGMQYPDGSKVTYGYDSVGRLSSVAEKNGTTSFTYNALDMPAQTLLPTGQRLSYLYDSVGNKTGLVSSFGATAYERDLSGRIIAVSNPFGERTTFSYDVNDREVSRQFANGTVLETQYDLMGRITSTNLSLNSSAISAYTCTYDVAGNPRGIVELDGTRVTFTHDPIGRLINECKTGSSYYNVTYTYDPAGNRLSKNDDGLLTTYTYNAANELIGVINPSGTRITNTYDRNGNLIVTNSSGVLTTFTWDTENRLINVAAGSSVETYTYNANGQRQTRTTGSDTTSYVWDDQRLLSETSFPSASRAFYTSLPETWGSTVSQNSNGNSYFFGFDPWNNIRSLTTLGGAISDTYSFRAFGDEATVTGQTPNPFRYHGLSGYYTDTPERLYVRARYLNTSTGRWISPDPLGITSLLNDDTNLYAYASNSPLIFNDPSGLARLRLTVPRLQQLSRDLGNPSDPVSVGLQFEDSVIHATRAHPNDRNAFSYFKRSKGLGSSYVRPDEASSITRFRVDDKDNIQRTTYKNVWFTEIKAISRPITMRDNSYQVPGEIDAVGTDKSELPSFVPGNVLRVDANAIRRDGSAPVFHWISISTGMDVSAVTWYANIKRVTFLSSEVYELCPRRSDLIYSELNIEVEQPSHVNGGFIGWLYPFLFYRYGYYPLYKW